MGNTEMNALRKKLNTPKTAYRDFFSNRPNSPIFLSHNILNNEYIPSQRPPTIDTTTRCGDNVIADMDSATDTVVRTYITPMLDSNVSMTIAGTTPATYYYNQDERMSVMNLTDGTGAVSQSYGYTAYGDKVDSLTSGTVEQRYTYTGRELSTVSDDYYFRYRWYGAASGSFMTRDPLGYVDGPSLYNGYFASLAMVDPTGSNVEVFKYAVNFKSAENMAFRLVDLKKGVPAAIMHTAYAAKHYCISLVEDNPDTPENEGDGKCKLRFKVALVLGAEVNNTLTDAGGKKKPLPLTDVKVEEWLADDPTSRMARKIKVTTHNGIAGSTGHEQRHARNMLNAFWEANKILAKAGTKQYASNEECQAAGKEAISGLNGWNSAMGNMYIRQMNGNNDQADPARVIDGHGFPLLPKSPYADLAKLKSIKKDGNGYWQGDYQWTRYEAYMNHMFGVKGIPKRSGKNDPNGVYFKEYEKDR